MTVDGAGSKFHAQIAKEVSAGYHDTGFDFDLRVGPVQLSDDGFGGLNVLRNVGDDQTVRALIYLYYAARAEAAAYYLKQATTLYAGRTSVPSGTGV